MEEPHRRSYDLLEPACLELLRASMDKPVRNISELNEKVVRFALCFIDHAQQLFQMRQDLQSHAEEEMIMFREIRHEIEQAFISPKFSTFDKVLIWFRDKVLPALIIALITGVVTWIVAVNTIININAGVP